MKKTIYIVWHSFEDESNCGCWYDDMKVKVFNSKKDALKYLDNLQHTIGCYCDIVKKTIKV